MNRMIGEYLLSFCADLVAQDLIAAARFAPSTGRFYPNKKADYRSHATQIAACPAKRC